VLPESWFSGRQNVGNVMMIGDAVSYLNGLRVPTPRVAIVLGSGLQSLAESVTDQITVPYKDVPGFPEPSVEGHSGSLVFGRIGGTDVVCQLGRFHLYEGWDEETVVFPVRVFASLGVEILVVTNAAGGLNRAADPPSLMLISDHINFMFRSPLAGSIVKPEVRFPDMSSPYDPVLRNLAQSVARERGIGLQPGVYVGVLGPSYETPAEIHMLDRIGADAVGMSTVPEVIAARARNLRVLGISTITNLAAGISPEKLSHEGVLAAGKQAGSMLTMLITGIVERI